MDTMQRIVEGVFDSRDDAEAAVRELRWLGLAAGDILVVARAGALAEQAREILASHRAHFYADDDECELEPAPLPGD